MIIDTVRRTAADKKNKNIGYNVLTDATAAYGIGNWHLYNGDCVDVVSKLPDESIGFSVFSPPLP